MEKGILITVLALMTALVWVIGSYFFVNQNLAKG